MEHSPRFTGRAPEYPSEQVSPIGQIIAPVLRAGKLTLGSHSRLEDINAHFPHWVSYLSGCNSLGAMLYWLHTLDLVGSPDFSGLLIRYREAVSGEPVCGGDGIG